MIITHQRSGIWVISATEMVEFWPRDLTHHPVIQDAIKAIKYSITVS